MKKFVFNFSEISPDNPILITGTADSLEEAKYMFKTGVRIYAKGAGYKKSEIKKLVNLTDLVEPEILEEYAWTIDLLTKDVLNDV